MCSGFGVTGHGSVGVFGFHRLRQLVTVAMRRSPTCSRRTLIAFGERPSSVIMMSAADSGANEGQADDGPLRRVGTDDHLVGALNERLVGFGLGEVGCGEAGDAVHPVHTEEQLVDVQAADRLVGDRSHQRCAGSSYPASEDDRLGPRPSAVSAPMRSATVVELVTTVRPGMAGDVLLRGSRSWFRPTGRRPIRV